MMSPWPASTARSPENAESAASLAVASAFLMSANSSGQLLSRGRAAFKSSSGFPAASITRSKEGGWKFRAMKPSASSDCNSGGNTAIMPSITTSLIALMELRRLQEPRAVNRGEHDIEGHALMMHGQRHIHTGRPKRPELAIEARLARDFIAVDGEGHIAGLEFGACGRALCGDADDHDLVVDLGGIHAKPGARRLVDAAELAQIVQDRLQEVDRHDH